MKNILIPTDFSENAWNAVEYAVNFFQKSSCSFYMLHVGDSKGNENIISEKLYEKSMKKVLKRIENDLPKNKNHRFFSIIDAGYIVNSIRSQVEKKQIDVIVMGTKGTSDLKKIPLGTNASNVITKVKCTTLVVPKNAKYLGLNEIAFPTDFLSLYSSKILEPITQIIEESKAFIRVLHIKNENAILNDDQEKNRIILDNYLGLNEHSFHFLTNNHIENQVQDFVEYKKVDLITMLGKNLNYFEKILFHPTMPEIKYYTDIPFLVLH